jgi:hypothetical protein
VPLADADRGQRRARRLVQAAVVRSFDLYLD